MPEQYALQGVFKIDDIVKSMRIIAEQAKKAGVDVKTFLSNDTEGKKFVEMLGKAQTQLNNLTKKTNELVPAAKQANTGISTMNSAIGQFGYLLGDADMFMVNFRMGMMSVANNVPIFVQMLTYANQEAKNMNQTLGQALVQSLKGPGGLLLAINGVMLLMNIFAKVFSDTTKDIKAQKDEVDQLVRKYKELSTIDLAAEKSSLEWRKQFLTSAMSEIESRKVKEPIMFEGRKVGERTVFANRADEERYNYLSQQLGLINGQLKELKQNADTAEANIKSIFAGTFDISSIDKVQNALKIMRLESRFINMNDKEQVKLYADKIIYLEAIEKKYRGQFEAVENISKAEKKAKDNLGNMPAKGLDKAGQFPIGNLTGTPGESNMSGFLELIGYNPIEDNTGKVDALGTAWNRTGDIIYSSLSRSLGLLKQTDNMLANIFNQLMAMGLQMALSGLWGGLASVVSGGGFLSPFLGAFGIKLADGGVLNEPVAGIGLNSKRSYLMGEAGPEAVMPLNKMPRQYPANINLTINGEFRARGDEMYALVRRIEKLERRYK